MARALAHARTLELGLAELLRVAMVCGSALALIAAGRILPI